MGSDDPDSHAADGESPVRAVEVDPFWIDTTTVTNDAFAKFVDATGYQTDAERFGWSFVFHLHVDAALQDRFARVAGAEWWLQVPGASWHAPFGPGSDISAIRDHPAVHVSWHDAVAFGDWIGKRLPTEAEWEFAARGGLEQQRFPWGSDFPTGPDARANIFEGDFPTHDTGADGFAGTAPARSFPPNGSGLYNTVGNVWEWTADWFGLPGSDPFPPVTGTGKVTKGGSFLCHVSWCNRYRVAARTSNTPDSSTANTGFRMARDREAWS